MSRWLSLHGKSITLTGVFSSVQKRQLVRRLKASGASLHPSERTMPARVDVVVAAEFPDPAVVSEALERGARAYSEEEFIETIPFTCGVSLNSGASVLTTARCSSVSGVSRLGMKPVCTTNPGATRWNAMPS